MNKKIHQQLHSNNNFITQNSVHSWNPYFNTFDKSPHKKSILTQRSPSPKILNIQPIKCLYKKNQSNQKQVNKSKSLKKGLFQLQIEKVNKQNCPYEMNYIPLSKGAKKGQGSSSRNNMFTDLIKKIQSNTKRQNSGQSTSSQKINFSRDTQQKNNVIDTSSTSKLKKQQTLCFKNINSSNNKCSKIKQQKQIRQKNHKYNNYNPSVATEYQLQQTKFSTLSLHSNSSSNKLQFQKTQSNPIHKEKSFQKFSQLPSSCTTIPAPSLINNNTHSQIDLNKYTKEKIKPKNQLSIANSLDKVNISRDNQSKDELDMSPYLN